LRFGDAIENTNPKEKIKMKKLMLVLPLTVLMLSFSLTIASAGVDWEDPALCVAGQWLLIDAAQPSAVTVIVPENTRYGDQKAGGCKTPGPSVPLIQNVKVRDDGDTMRVQVDGKNASTPNVKASFGNRTQTKSNNGKQTLNFRFDLP